VPVRYGLIQARIKIPRARGIWPAFWMLGQDIGQSGWPGCGEIDVMEHFGTGPATVYGTVHGPGYSGRGGISASCAVGPSLGVPYAECEEMCYFFAHLSRERYGKFHGRPE
jgi:beta-glucanase (GH16 family)